MVEDNRGNVMLQEVEALELNKFMHIDLLDEIRNTLEILQKKKKQGNKIRYRARRIDEGKKNLRNISVNKNFVIFQIKLFKI